MKALRITMGVVACLLTVAALLSAFAHFYVFNPKKYEDEIFTDGFYAAVILHRDKALDELESVVDIEREVLLTHFGDAECKAVAEDYVRALLRDVLLGGSSIDRVGFDTAELDSYIHTEFAKYDFSETEYGDSDTAAAKASEMVSAKLKTAVCFTPQNYVQKALRYVASLRDLVVELCSYWYIPAMLAVALYIGMVLLMKRASGIFMPAAFLWCGCALVFIPAAMLFFGDVASGFELSKNQLYYFILGVVETVKSGLLITSVVPFCIASALLGVGSYFKAKDE